MWKQGKSGIKRRFFINVGLWKKEGMSTGAQATAFFFRNLPVDSTAFCGKPYFLALTLEVICFTVSANALSVRSWFSTRLRELSTVE